ncbi:MAG: SRPBCC domain-containing protein [Bacteroidetes bacterium]|nr:SRPBCC domain-containing protein [Bacteroidota bacterium]
MEQNLTTEKKKTVSIKKTFNLPLKTVWKAFTEPETFKKWCGPENYTCPAASIDFKVGGKYLFSMKGEDGKEIWSTGTYKEIIPFKKIVYTDNFSDSNGNIIPASDYNMPGEWNSDLLVTILFEEVDGKTNLSLEHVGIPAEVYNDTHSGWQSMLDKIEKNIK